MATDREPGRVTQPVVAEFQLRGRTCRTEISFPEDGVFGREGFAESIVWKGNVYWAL